jgi:hypothetical protein
MLLLCWLNRWVGERSNFSTWNFCNVRTWNNSMLWWWTLNLITNFVIYFWVVSFVALEKIDATSFVMFKRTYTPYNEFCKFFFAQCISENIDKNPDLGFSLHCASPCINNSPPSMLLLKKNTHTLISFWWCLSSHSCAL